MENRNRNPEVEKMINNILGAAIMGAMTEKQSEDAPSKEVDNALMVRKQYEAFLEVGFNEEQATAFMAAMLA